MIASFITADQRYGGTQFPILLLAKGDEVLVGESSHVTFSSTETATEEKSGKPVASRLAWDFKDGNKAYRISFRRQKDLVRTSLLNGLPAGRLLQRPRGLSPVGETGFDRLTQGFLTRRRHTAFAHKPLPARANLLPDLSAAVPSSPLESSPALETLWRRRNRSYRAGALRTAAMFSDSPMAEQ